jgi:hypothetical protein
MSDALERLMHSESDEGDTADSDNVLLQSALGFTIVLVYLLTMGMASQVDLTGQLKNSQTRLKDSEETRRRKEDAFRGWSEKQGGQLAKDAVDKTVENQKLQLLLAWQRYRPTRPLYRRLLLSGKGPLAIRLMEESGFLPDPRDHDHAELVREANRTFHKATAPERVSREEVARLVIEVWRRVKNLNRAVTRARAAEATRRAFEQVRHFEDDVVERVDGLHKNEPLLENLASLADAIRKDLSDERALLVELQFRLVAHIAQLRLERGGNSRSTSEGSQYLQEIVGELRRPLGLLPEVEQRLLSGL